MRKYLLMNRGSGACRILVVYAQKALDHEFEGAPPKRYCKAFGVRKWLFWNTWNTGSENKLPIIFLALWVRQLNQMLAPEMCLNYLNVTWFGLYSVVSTIAHAHVAFASRPLGPKWGLVSACRIYFNCQSNWAKSFKTFFLIILTSTDLAGSTAPSNTFLDESSRGAARKFSRGAHIASAKGAKLQVLKARIL